MDDMDDRYCVLPAVKVVGVLDVLGPWKVLGSGAPVGAPVHDKEIMMQEPGSVNPRFEVQCTAAPPRCAYCT